MSPARIRGRPAFAIASAIVLLAVPLAACSGEGGGGDGTWGGRVDTLASGAIRVVNPQEGLWGEEERWALELDVRIGALESGGPDQLGSVADVAVDGAGRIWVLERQAQEVRVFDSRGAHVRTLGGPGGGPGELGNPVALEWGPRGNLWVVDFGNRRYEVFDTAGARLTSHPFQGRTFGFGIRLGPDGLLYEMAAVQEPEFRSVVVRRGFPSGEAENLEVVDTLARPDLEEGETVEVSLSQGGATFVMQLPVPLTPRHLAELVPGRGWWLSGPGSAYRLARTGFGGDTSLVVERAYEPVPVTDQARAEALEAVPDGVDLSPGRIPDVHPPVSGLEPSPDGGVWVRRQVATDREGFDVFDAEGRYLGEVVSEVPLDRFTLHAFLDDALYGVLTDELDVPYVVRLALRRP